MYSFVALVAVEVFSEGFAAFSILLFRLDVAWGKKKVDLHSVGSTDVV
uniref:Uncharacterized protein n=1 Tax=Arundo donax TaxID=35708 RepID=A0A0A8Z6W2_ARUDO